MNRPTRVETNTVVVQSKDLMSSELDGETVLMSVTQAAYFGLDSTAQKIWNMIAQPRQVADLCTRLTIDYDVDRSTCEQDVCAFLTELNEEGLIRIIVEDGG